MLFVGLSDRDEPATRSRPAISFGIRFVMISEQGRNLAGGPTKFDSCGSTAVFSLPSGLQSREGTNETSDLLIVPVK